MTRTGMMQKSESLTDKKQVARQLDGEAIEKNEPTYPKQMARLPEFIRLTGECSCTRWRC